MKNNLYFLIIFLFVGCTPNSAITTKTDCPKVLFGAGQSKYIAGNTQPININNIRYSANINNYLFNKGCSITNNFLQTDLSLLFIVKPDQAEKDSITLPFYVAVLNESDELTDMQYYKTQGDFKKDSVNKKYVETEIVETITLQIPFKVDQKNFNYTIVVGFMLNKEKLMILN